jgi:hypothetical protein
LLGSSSGGIVPLFATVTLAASAVLLLAWMLWRQYRSPKWSTFALNLLGLILYVLLLRSLFGFPDFAPPQPKGPQDIQFLALALAMYVCMLAGMAAEYLYHFFDASPSRPRQFDIGSFVKPFLVSPLVFMPLAASLQNANLDFSRFDAPRLMVFLVAFENGFLWRGYFSRKLAESARAAAQGGGK